MPPRPVVLLILDGVGWGRRDDGDAVYLADTPVLDGLLATRPWGLLQAHGKAVGMPSNADMGNSEVGHNAMGAGRVFDQGAKLVGQAISSGQIWQSDAWRAVMERTRDGGTLHLLGLLSDGNVHSHVDHLRALIAEAARAGVARLRVHGLTDGRDVAQRSALTWFAPIQRELAALPGDYAIATGGGRMCITMDRYEADWAMVKRGWDCHVHGQGRRFDSATLAIQTLYAEDPSVNDQYLPPFVVGDYDGMQDGDAVVFFNFRGDRAIEISRAFTDPGLTDIDRTGPDGRAAPALTYVGMMEYDGDLHIPPAYLVRPPAISDTVSDQLAAAGKHSFAISETQKFGHVTYFFNGNNSAPPPGEDRFEEPSLKVPFDQAPAMSAEQVTTVAAQAIRSGRYDHVRINLANGDMVGHTGRLAPTIRAMEVVDHCVGRLALAVQDAGGVLLVTADHGNADEMFRPTKDHHGYLAGPDGARLPSTSHSLNPVPVVMADFSDTWRLKATSPGETLGGLASIGATILDLCEVPVPAAYEPSLVSIPAV